jgi:hypothetical protein
MVADATALFEENPHPYCALYRTETLRRVGGWHGQLSLFPDWGMWIDLIQRGARFAYARDAVFHYRVRSDSASSGISAEARRAEVDRLARFYPTVPR